VSANRFAIPAVAPGASIDETLQALRASATVRHTPCGDGRMVWHVWGEGRPLVLLHGGGGSWEHWVSNVAALAPHRQIWCADLPSLGDSATAPGAGEVHEIAQATAEGLLAHFPEPGSFDVAGFSFGALIGLEVAAMLPDHIGHLVLVGAASLGLPRKPLAMKIWRKEPDPQARLAMHAVNLKLLMVASPDPHPQAIALHARSVERGRYNGRKMARTPRVRDLIPQVRVRRLDAIYGSLDATADPGTGPDTLAVEALYRSLRPGLRFVRIDGAGHWVQHEAAEAFNTALLDLLNPALVL
jgi:pimeloyl-ACP methyl ester carboxylesterase